MVAGRSCATTRPARTCRGRTTSRTPGRFRSSSTCGPPSASSGSSRWPACTSRWARSAMPSGGPAGWSRARTRARGPSARRQRLPGPRGVRRHPRRGRGDGRRRRARHARRAHRPPSARREVPALLQLPGDLPPRARRRRGRRERKRRRRTMTATDRPARARGPRTARRRPRRADAREPAAPPAPPSPGFEPTAEQRAAVGSRGRDTFLEAGAGSGKTSVLVDRYCAAVDRGRGRGRAHPRLYLHRARRGRDADADPARARRPLPGRP